MGLIQTFSAYQWPNQDRLVFNDQLGITGEYKQQSCELKLTGARPIEDYETALTTVKYNNTNIDNPDPAIRVINIRAKGDSVTGPTVTKNVAILTENDPTFISTNASAITFTEDGPSVPVAEQIMIDDLDDTQLTQATVIIAQNFKQGEDVLEFTPQGNVVGNYNTQTGVLTLSGQATKEDYQATLRTVRYKNKNNKNPDTKNKVVQIKVIDITGLASNTVSKNLKIQAVNDPVELIKPSRREETQVGKKFSKDFSDMFSDPDGDELQYKIFQSNNSSAFDWLKCHNAFCSGIPNKAGTVNLGINATELGPNATSASGSIAIDILNKPASSGSGLGNDTVTALAVGGSALLLGTLGMFAWRRWIKKNNGQVEGQGKRNRRAKGDIDQLQAEQDIENKRENAVEIELPVEKSNIAIQTETEVDEGEERTIVFGA